MAKYGLIYPENNARVNRKEFGSLQEGIEYFLSGTNWTRIKAQEGEAAFLNELTGDIIKIKELEDDNEK